MGKSPLRVLIAEDSPTVRRFLSDLITEAPDMAVVGQASDGHEAVALAARLRPDIISMDLKMPNLDGLGAITQLMQTTPIPIIVVSSYLHRNRDRDDLSEDDVDLAFLALQAGALAVLRTPPHRDHPDFAARRDEFLNTLRRMAGVTLVRRWKSEPVEPVVNAASSARSNSIHRHVSGSTAPGMPRPSLTAPSRLRAPRVIVIGASAGGPLALRKLLGQLPANFGVPIAVVQHMADGFVEGLVRWLDNHTPLRVSQAEQGQIIRAGDVVFAGTGAHMMLRPVGSSARVVLRTSKAPGPYLPAVDVLFESAAKQFGEKAVGILLTGMGEDGAAGLLAMRKSGALTLVQEEESCLVYGMPQAAVKLDAAEQIMSLADIAQVLVKSL